nr:citrate synthase [Trinickia mobilis]
MLSIKKESLYTYVSRGLIRTTKHKDGRRRRYLKSDVEKLRTRSPGHLEKPHVSHTLRYGEPIVQTWISEITNQGPRYRGHLATRLVTDLRSFEVVAELLWTGVLNPREVVWPLQVIPADISVHTAARQAQSPNINPLAWLTLLTHLISTSPLLEASTRAHDPVSTGIQLIQTFCGAAGLIGPKRTYLPPNEGETVAACIARGLGRERDSEVIRILDAALVLSAENELAAPTFAARICASTGADLYACVASALQVQSGPMQVGGTFDVEIMLEALTRARGRPESRLAGYSRGGLPCFNHPLYERDPRAAALLALVASLERPQGGTPAVLDFIVSTERSSGQYPNIFAALVVATRALGLPSGTAAFLHTVGRTSGWLAHAVEQRLTGTMLRPRAKYMGAKSSD